VPFNTLRSVLSKRAVSAETPSHIQLRVGDSIVWPAETPSCMTATCFQRYCTRSLLVAESAVNGSHYHESRLFHARFLPFAVMASSRREMTCSPAPQGTAVREWLDKGQFLLWL